MIGPALGTGESVRASQANALLEPPAKVGARRLGQLAGAGLRYGAGSGVDLIRRRSKVAPTGPRQLRLAFESLGPTFVKLGQFVSSSPGTFPDALVAEFAHCQDSVPAEPWELAARTITAQVGDLRSAFRWIEWEPMAAGSIAQVHAATLHDGRQVVVKVQRTGLEAVLRKDLRLLLGGARLGVRLMKSLEVANPVGVIEDFAACLVDELHFRTEAQNMEEIRRSLTGWPVVIPEVVRELSGDRVLVMERVDGVKLTDVDAVSNLGIDAVTLCDLLISSSLSTALRHGTFHGDGHAGNLIVLPDGQLGMYDFGIVGRLDPTSRRRVSGFLGALFEQRWDDVVIQLLDVTGADAAAMEPLITEFGDVAGRYLSGPLVDLPTAALFGELMQSANRHRIGLPTDLVLFFKQLLYLDGLCRVLNPGFDVFADGMRYAPFFAAEAGGAPLDEPARPLGR